MGFVEIFFTLVITIGFGIGFMYLCVWLIITHDDLKYGRVKSSTNNKIHKRIEATNILKEELPESKLTNNEDSYSIHVDEKGNKTVIYN